MSSATSKTSLTEKDGHQVCIRVSSVRVAQMTLRQSRTEMTPGGLESDVMVNYVFMLIWLALLLTVVCFASQGIHRVVPAVLCVAMAVYYLCRICQKRNGKQSASV
jgi:hypothetical protein